MNIGQTLVVLWAAIGAQTTTDWPRALVCCGMKDRIVPIGARDTVVRDTAITRAVRGLDGFVQRRADSGRFSGVVLVGLLDGRGGAALFQRAYGLANRADGTLNAVDTKFITASAAKAFTAVAVATLVARGALAYDAPVSRYLPDSVFPRERGDHITVDQLLTHRAGLGDVVASRAFRSAPASFTRLDQLVALVRAEAPVGEPGTYRYGDSDYILLGAIVERVSGQPFADYVRDHVFHPARMTGTSFVVVPRPVDLAHGYTSRDLGGPTYARPSGDPLPPLQANDPILPGVGVPSAVAFTTAGDLMRLAVALRAHHLLRGRESDTMWTGHVETGQGDANAANRQYGYGFFVGTVGGNRIVNHGGTGPGIDVGFDIYPDLGYVVVVLANFDPPAAQDVRAFLRDAFAHVGGH
jgi:CubicO group peptidase (beta-lactamase class C family)